MSLFERIVSTDEITGKAKIRKYTSLDTSINSSKIGREPSS